MNLAGYLYGAMVRRRGREERAAREAWQAWDRAPENRCSRCGLGYEHDHGGAIYTPRQIPLQFQRFVARPDVVAVDDAGGEPAEGDEEAGA